MGSVGSPHKSRTPFDAYKDCAQGICNIYCSQWCSYPPPLDSGDDSGSSFSPLIIAVIGILASAFLLVCYYAIITKYCRRRRGSSSSSSRWRRNHNNIVEAELQLNHDQLQVDSNSGLDEGLIKSITVFQYKKGVGLVEGTECSVCLNEFQENENLRLLPKCCHAFHPSCIDIWLKSHSNCPLCRANAAPISTPTPPIAATAPNPATQSSSVLNISAMEIHRPNDLVVVIDHHQEVCVNGVSGFLSKNLQQDPAIRNKKIMDQDGSREMRISRFSTGGGLLVADVLEMSEDEEIKVEIQQQLEIKIMGSSKRVEDQESK